MDIGESQLQGCSKLVNWSDHLQDSFTLDEMDLALINAIQIAPRAAWSTIGRALELSPTTATRRWQRITDNGLAWVTTYPRLKVWARHHCMACVEVDCAPAERDQVVAALAQKPQVISLHQAGSGRDLFALVMTADLHALSRFVLEQLSKLSGVHRVRTHPVTQVYSEGSTWRLNALTPAQRTYLNRHAPPGNVESEILPERYRELLLALGGDGRRSVAQLASLSSTSLSTTRRRLQRVLHEGMITLRCEVAQNIAGWPASAILWARVPPDHLDAAARTLSTLPELRFCAAITGANNLVMIVWLNSASDLLRLETSLAERLPTVTLTERAITLRQSKRQGWLLDDVGRATAVIPIDPWHEIEAPTSA
ncbi:Lrp/AsnC family transcriptional regulator [Lentzea sp. E54]|uniref:Lrp/AsnC family transcriptional regulator n=1 Tax=Lentzea xerophila TaxID=3435883 RepID=UPI003DA35956